MNWKLRGKHKQDGEPTPEDLVKIKTVGSNKNFVNMEDVEEKNSNGMVYNIKNNVLTIKGAATANTTLIFNSKISVDLEANAYTLNANKNGSLTGVFGYYIYGSTAQSSARKTLEEFYALKKLLNNSFEKSSNKFKEDYSKCIMKQLDLKEECHKGGSRLKVASIFIFLMTSLTLGLIYVVSSMLI